MLNKIRYLIRKVRGDIRANEYIYYPKDFFTDVEEVPEVFTKIYSKNTWGSAESVSGRGSELKHTQVLLRKLEYLTKDFQVQSMLDSPCGDFNWMQFLDKSNLTYIGMDIVPELIPPLNLKYGQDSKVTFMHGNMIEDQLPKVDLIFCRDCLVHFSFSDIKKTLLNFKNSGARYLLTTTYKDRGVNRDIRTGGWRALNLELPPFNLPKPLKIIKENNLDDNGVYFDKCMGLWDLSQLTLKEEQ